MKTQHWIFALLLIGSMLSVKNVQASHGTGGELTWTCLGSGQYVFQCKFYRDCNGIPGPASITINTSVPGVPNIFASLASQTDISTDGYYSDGDSLCPNCPQGGSPAIAGLIEEFVYESAPITLPGVPPPGGWTFSWGECCRSAALTNITGGGGIGFLLQAKMFSFNGQNADPCFDSSPYFAERPNIILCSGLPFVYNQISADAEYDSLVYEFDSPLDDLGNPIPLAAPYTISNPLPGSCTLNPNTGELSFTPTIGGYFTLVAKVNSYKCGIKTAEIRREINVSILTNCAPIFGGGINLPPEVTPPFIDPDSGLQTSYADTVIAGDTVNFNLIASDFQFFNNNQGQIITLNAFGLQYGSNFTDPVAGCLIPPCATLSQQPPISSALGASTTFNWVTSPAHLGYSLSCVQFLNTYYFLSKVTDNYCPANGSNSRVFSITILSAIPAPLVVNNGGALECNLGGSYTYQWFYNSFAIPGATNSSYTPAQVGNYQVLAIAPSGQANYSTGYYFNPLGINENDFIVSLSVQPNPSTEGIFMINAEMKKNSRLSIYVADIYGREVITENRTALKGNTTFEIDLSKQAAGMYVMDLRDENSGVTTMKLIKSR